MTQKETKGPTPETHILVLKIYAVPRKGQMLQQSFTLINKANIILINYFATNEKALSTVMKISP